MSRLQAEPVWHQIDLPKFSPLKKAAHFDVGVVGGGITGLSAALLLKQAGKSVCLLERDTLCSGDTGYTTAHLTYVTDVRLHELVKTFGREEAALTWHAGAAAIDLIEHNVRDNAIECQFVRVPGFLHAKWEGEKDETKELEQEAELAQELGFDAEFVESVPVAKKAGIRFRDQAKFHPLAYLAAIARLVDGDGCAIHEQSEVTKVTDDPLTVETKSASVTCDYLVIATHVPLVGKTNTLKAGLFQSKLASFSTYAIGAKLMNKRLHEMSLWDTSSPYYYLRIDRNQDGMYAIFGGCDHKTGQEQHTEQSYHKLESLFGKISPGAQVDHRWSGQVVETNDGLPFIGEIAERQFVATGFAGNGMTFGSIAGMMARDAVLGKDNPWRDLFSVDRKKIRGGTWRYLKENFDYPYYYLADRVFADGVFDPFDQAGEGKIMKIDGEHIACSRDSDGKLEQVSAVCTHMGCLVHWNRAEHTWDCPCHGSRFHANGEVMAGPAETPLKHHKKKAVARTAKH